MNKRLEVFAGLLVVAASLSPVSSAFAMGGSKPTQPPYTLPNPLRYVVVRPIQNVAGFEAPNQVTTSVSDAQDCIERDS